MRSLVERVAATTGAEVRRRLRPRRAARWSTTRARWPCCAPPRWRRSAATAWCCRRRAWAARTSAGSPTCMPIALARLGTHGGGPPLDLHRGTFDVDERAIGVGVRLLARTALHALEADAGTPPGPPAPAAHGARRPETLQPDEPSTRGGNPTMSPTDQQADRRPAHRRRRGAGRARGPRGPRARRRVRRRHARPVARARRRRAAQGRPRGPARPGRGRAEPHGRHRRPRRPAVHRRRTPATCRPRSASPGCAPFVRGARGRARIRRAASPGGWDVRQRHAHPDVASTKEAIAADLENGVTSLWLVLGEGAIPVDALGDVLADVLLDLAPVTRRRAGRPAAEAFLSLVEGRTDLAPGGSLGLDPLGLQAASGEPQDLVRSGRRRPPGGRPPRDCGRSSSTRTVFADAGASAVEELGCSLAAGVAYLRALTDGRAVGRRGVRPAGVPLRRERRPVHDHRRAARRPPAVGPGRRGQRRLARGPRASASTPSPRR